MDANVKARARRAMRAGLLVLASWSATLATLTVRAQTSDEWTNSIGMEFVWIPAGQFPMGSASAQANADEGPVRQVRISRGFYMGKFELTQAQWREVMGSNPSTHGTCGADCPAESVSWHEAQAFVKRLKRVGGREPDSSADRGGMGVRGAGRNDRREVRRRLGCDSEVRERSRSAICGDEGSEWVRPA